MERVIFLISADPALTQQVISELVASGVHYQLPLAVNIAQARQRFRRLAPTVILLDESAVAQEKDAEGKAADSLESVVAMLTECAPVVVLAAPDRQAELAFLITSGAMDFVARVGDFIPLTVGLLERRVRLAEQADGAVSSPNAELVGDFGEILRHEVNNPLTGILGNAELLLAEYKKRNGDRMPTEAAIQRLQTIAELAVRLRETIRRLSNTWEGRHDQARLA